MQNNFDSPMSMLVRRQRSVEMSIVLGLLVIFFVLLGYGVEASQYVSSQDLEFLSDGQLYRTSYHFQPSRNWMNDPNGPMYYKGVYHFFYQHNPHGPLWDEYIVWGHSISYDLINWVHLDTAFYPTESFDIKGCWSGSATILPGDKPVIMYTGIDSLSREVQNLIVPKNFSDPYLREWQKAPQNPLMTPFDGIGVRSFRDPTTAWKGPDEMWRLIIGSEIDGLGMAFLYRSRDFINWTRSEDPLHLSPKTGMWECVDFFPVSTSSINGVETSDQDESNKHVLKTSFFDNKHDCYLLGKYLPETEQFVADFNFVGVSTDLRYDYGKFYASKTFYDGANRRRILWGWVNESDSDSDAYVKGWAGLQAIPRTIFLSKSGKQLVQWPVKEIERLRGEKASIYDKELKVGSIIEISGITASQADVEVSFDGMTIENAESMDTSLVDPQLLCSQKDASAGGTIGPFGLLVLASNNLEEQTAVFFRVLRNNYKYVVLMCSDQSRSSLREGLDKTTYGAFVDIDPLHEKISLRSLIDHSIIESFGGEGKTCITARVYPKLAIDGGARLYAFNNGTESVKISKISAWSMKRAQMKPISKKSIPELFESNADL